MDRTRGDGARGARVVVGGADGDHLVPVAVGGIEDGACDIGPALHGAGAGAVVGAVGGLRVQHVEDGLGHVAREGQAAQLVVDDRDLREPVLGVGDAVGQALHRLDEVVPLADDPAGAHDVVAGAPGHGDVAGGLGLAVDGQRAEGLLLVMDLRRAVEDVVAGHVDERDPALGAGAGEQRRAGGVGLPGGHAALGGLRLIYRRVGAAVDDRAVERPVVLRIGRRV